MFKPLLFLTVFISFFLFNADAQTDTSSYDLGRVSVKKDFTQTVTIKGSDLEHYQFSDLADAINVWLYGTYTNAGSLIYVVNGNIVTDVNAYSIYDVDEITLVQSALAQASGAGTGQQMILIKLKTNRHEKQGVTAAGQTSLVNSWNLNKNDGLKSTTGLYNQYYISAFKNIGNVNTGVSFDYQRDVLPALSDSTLSHINSLHLNRFKLNGYLNTPLWRGSTVNFGINYVPQQNSFGYTYTQPQNPYGTSNTKVNAGMVQHLVNTNLTLNSHIIGGLTNSLSGAFSHYNEFEDDSLHMTSLSSFSGALPQNSYTTSFSDQKMSNVIVHDNLSYNGHIGQWGINPAINLAYRYISVYDKDSTRYLTLYGDGLPGFGYSSIRGGDDFKTLIMTPSLGITYGDIFYAQGGFTDLLNVKRSYGFYFPSSDLGSAIPRLFPFFSTGLDVFKLAGLSGMKFKIFASFSKQTELLDEPEITLYNFDSPMTVPSSNNIPTIIDFNTLNQFHAAPVSIDGSQYNPYAKLNNYEVGFTWDMFKNFSVNYTFEDKYAPTMALVRYTFDGGAFVEYENVNYYIRAVTNRLGLNCGLSAGDFTWKAGFNIAEEKLLPDDNVLTDKYNAYLGNGHRYSGGFTNRFQYKTLFAGVDVLYQAGQRPLDLNTVNLLNPTSPPNVNLFSLQSLYVGTQLKITHTNYAEVFINTRTLLENNPAYFADNRRFYGLGFKVSL